MFSEIFSDNLFLVTLIGAIGYWCASGAERADYKILHVAIGISLFFVLALIVYCTLEQFVPSLISLGISLIIVACIAVLWRKLLAERTFRLLRGAGITSIPFGPSATFDIIGSVPGRQFHSFSVELKDGKILVSNTQGLGNDELLKEHNCPPEIITDEDGNVALLVTEIHEDGKDPIIKDPANKKTDLIEYTYIPASNIRTIKALFNTKRKVRLCG